MTKMNPEVKAQWLTALRSGEYKQASGVLNNGKGGFCCLGVLCDITAKQLDLKLGVQSVEDCDADDCGSCGIITYSGNTSYLPDEVADHAEIEYRGMLSSSAKAEINSNSNGNDEYYVNLAQMNDDGKSFVEIADVIEQYF